MDFKDFINQIKELADPAVFAIIAKLAIAFYFLKLLYKGFKELLKLAFAVKEKKDNFEESQVQIKEVKKTLNKVQEALDKTDLANKKRDEETHKLIKQSMLDSEKRISKIEENLSFLNAYRDVKHDKDEETVEARQTMKLVLEKLTLINK